MPDFLPSRPWRRFHPPALSLPREPLCPETRLFPIKAAASEDSRRTLWYIEPLSDARMKLAGLFSVLLGAVVEGERSHCRIVTRTIDFDGETGAGD